MRRRSRPRGDQRPTSPWRSEEHTSELQSRQYLHSFPTRRSSDLLAGVLVAVRPVALTSSWTDAATEPASRRPAANVTMAARWVSRAALRTVVTAPLPRDMVLPAWANKSLVDFWLRMRLTSFSPRIASPE